MRKLGLSVAAACMAFGGAAAHADDGLRGYFHLGAGQVSLNPNSVEMSIGGAAVPGAGFDASTEYPVVGELGIFVYGNWALSASLTSSVLTENTGTGPLAATPNIGSDSFMLSTLTGTYHFEPTPWMSPYVGGGVSYFHATGAYDGVVTNLAIDHAWGSVVQAGIDFNLTERAGAFVDLKQYFVGIDATGSFFGAPVLASADIDPLLVHAGVSYRF
ncbi:MAG: OmpW family protein [Hyphomonadaceae bacterium]|nr:OmpW family protein [Hyphomonadaceae bacterium]